MLLYALDGVLDRVFGAGASRPRVRPGHPRPAPGPRPASRSRALALTGASALAAAISLWLPVWQPLPMLPVRLQQRIAEEIGGWRSRTLAVDYQFLEGVRFDEVITRRYRDGPDSVDVFIGVGERGQRLRSPVSPKTALPGSGWIVEQTRAVALEPGGLEVESQVVRSRSSRRLVYHWQVGTESLGSEALRSLLALDASPWRRPGEVLVVRISTAVEGPDAAARQEAAERLLRFYYPLREEIAPLQGWLARKRFS
jgi:EpsI family protein